MCLDKEKNYTQTFAIRDTEAQHSSKFLTQLGKDVLQDNGIQKDHVLCIVTDNISIDYMVSTVKQPRKGSNITEVQQKFKNNLGLVTATN